MENITLTMTDNANIELANIELANVELAKIELANVEEDCAICAEKYNNSTHKLIMSGPKTLLYCI